MNYDAGYYIELLEEAEAQRDELLATLKDALQDWINGDGINVDAIRVAIAHAEKESK